MYFSHRWQSRLAQCWAYVGFLTAGKEGWAIVGPTLAKNVGPMNVFLSLAKHVGPMLGQHRLGRAIVGIKLHIQRYADVGKLRWPNMLVQRWHNMLGQRRTNEQNNVGPT